MLSGPHRVFVEGIVRGLSATDAYAAAYPKARRDSARGHAARLMTNDDIMAEVARMRAEAEKQAGSAILELAEVHRFLARLVRLNLATIDTAKDGDLLAGLDRIDGSNGAAGILKLRLPCKLAAIGRWADLKGEGAEAGANEALTGLLGRIRK